MAEAARAGNQRSGEDVARHEVVTPRALVAVVDSSHWTDRRTGEAMNLTRPAGPADGAPEQEPAAARALELLRGQKYLSLSVIHDGEPWCATICYAPLGTGTPALVFYSSARSVHSRALESSNRVAGTIFSLDDSGDVLDGLQLTGTVSEVPADALTSVHAAYYRRNFPDVAVREEWMIPVESFVAPHEQRFYRLDPDRIWLIDLDGWEVDKVDRRIEVSLPIKEPLGTEAAGDR